MLRKTLDVLYLASGCLAAIFLVMIAVLVLMQITARYFGVLFETNELSGFCLAATTFLGLAHTFKNGEHIRVSLLIANLRPGRRKKMELCCTGVGSVVMAYLAWQSAILVSESWQYMEISPGLMAVPMWIPQSGMFLGTLIMAIALADEFMRIARGHVPSYTEKEDIFAEEIVAEPESASNGPAFSVAMTSEVRQ